MKRITNRNASSYVAALKEFNGSNTFGRKVGKGYIAYSYGQHWILFLNDGNQWFGCSEKRSVSTSKHSTQLKPRLNDDIRWITQNELQNIKRYL